ncbi:MAG: hypothetical protein F6K58_16635, partial [Symploca sp. SIO2E9]|nr:hypothetical protein [Symploca sp. SIO2E9]
MLILPQNLVLKGERGGWVDGERGRWGDGGRGGWGDKDFEPLDAITKHLKGSKKAQNSC